MTAPTIIETVNITHEITWMPWAVSYFFLVAIAVGAALTSLMGTLLRRPGWEGATRISILVMWSAAIVAPVSLLADLHQPARFWHFYAHFTPWSWMSWGSFFLPVFAAAAIVYGWLVLRPELPRWARFDGLSLDGLIRPMALITGFMALLVALYTGSEVWIVRARPLWHSYTLIAFYFFSGVAASAAAGLLLNALLAENGAETRRAAARHLGRVMALFSLLTLLTGAVWIVLGLGTGGAPEQRALAIVAGSAHWQMLGWELLAAFGLSAILGIYSANPWIGTLVGLVTLAGAWLLRWAVFIDGQLIPKTGAGFYNYHLPSGPDGWLGILGVFGLWIAVILVETMVIRWHPTQAHATPAE